MCEVVTTKQYLTKGKKLSAQKKWFELKVTSIYLTFIGPCIANIFAEYNQHDTKFLNLYIPVRLSTYFRRFFRPSSGAQNCTYSVRYLSDQYCYVPLARPS